MIVFADSLDLDELFEKKIQISVFSLICFNSTNFLIKNKKICLKYTNFPNEYYGRIHLID